MKSTEFEASEIIAGFSLTSIKRAISWIGVMPDRNDVKDVAKRLTCQPAQAERVLEALERRGLVVKAAKKLQWEKTDLGHRLVYGWQPPRRVEPVIARDEENEDTSNECIETVPCSILRMAGDDETFEEADLEVGVSVEYESPRIIEISVSQPDDYDHRDDSSTIETSVYIGLDEARRFQKALLLAIEAAETELKRRATVKPRRTRWSPAARQQESGSAAAQASAAARATEERASKAAEKAREKEAAAATAKARREQAALEATLRELGGDTTD